MSLSSEKIYTKEGLKEELIQVLDAKFNVKPSNASDRQVYEALSSIIVNEFG